MKLCLEQAAPSITVYDITPIVHMDNYNIIRAHFREKSGVVLLLRRTYDTACIFDYFHLNCDHLVFYNGSVMQMKHNFCETHPKAARQTLGLQCGNLLCFTCLKHMLFVKAPWQVGSRVPIACPMCRNPQAFVCNMNEVGSQRGIQVDVYGLSPR